MPLTRLDNLLSSKTGKYIYVSPDDFNASDALDNRGNSQLRPFVSIQRAFLEVARFSYVPGVNNDRFDQFTIMLSPGPHYIDNRPGDADTSNVPIFNYDAATDTWNDPAIFDLGNPNNILYRFNGKDGGATIPRGTSLVGADLRRTQLRPLYVPDPADTDVPRTSLFNVTGGCYFWQFTILDANPDNGPLNGQSYSQPGSTQKSSPLYSHHKMTNFVYADKEDLSLLYRKISKCFSKYQEAIDDVYTDEAGRIQDTWSSTQSYTANTNVVFGGEAYKSLVNSTNKRPDLEDTFWERLNTISREFDFRIQENRIVGPLADTVQLDEIVVTEPSAGLLDVTVRTKINHGFFPGQYVAIDNTGLNRNLEGVFQVYSISTTNPKEFKYRVVTTASAVGLIPGASITPNSAATVLAEIDSVESASPYVFNVSIRSVWGICGIWADGRKATGFKSMVIAQYTGVSLQKDDRAFIRYDEFSNTWNQAPLTDAFATTPYHIKGDAFFKDDWRTFHVRASDDSFIQNVSIFAVGFADHFLLESGGDMSITNSNSNFGNTSMHSKGFKGFAFNQDKGGYITDIIPPKVLDDSAQPIKTSYYPIDVQLSKPSTNSNRLYLTGDKANNFLSRPAASINGYRIGARTYINDAKSEKIYVNTTADQTSGETGSTTKSAVVYPQGFKIWSSALDTLSPANLGIGDFNEDGTPNTAADTLLFNLRQDAANLIDANKIFIQAEAFGYILEKYPYLQTISYVNPNITFESGRYRDARNLILANRQEIVDYAYNQMLVSFPTFVPPSADKCKRDIGLIVDAVAADLYDGGNAHMIEATKAYFDVNGDPIVDGVVGEVTQSIFAFNRARDWAKKAISNLLGNNSLVPVISLTSSGTTVTATSSSAHNLKIGQEINVGGATQSQYNVYKTVVLASGLTPTQFQYQVSVAPTVGVATGAFYVSKVTIDIENTLNPAGRYKDARNRILANREFILDASLAEIAVYHPDFYIPGDTQSNVQSRFADAFRLIRRNSKEIADRALAKIAVDYPDFYFPGDAQTTADSRFNDSYRLIQQNKTEIVNTAWTSMVALYPGVASTETKCKRDLGYFVDAISLDLFIRGNEYSYRFAAEYFTNATTPLSNGLVGEVTESVYAFNEAKTLMKSAITNQLTIKDLTITPGPATYGGGGGNIANTSASSCADVRSSIDTLSGIVTTTITAGNLNSLPIQINKGSAPAGATKCARDIGYFIDAVSVDLFTGGNKHTRTFIQQYFTNATTPISNGLVGETAQSNTAFNEAAEFMRQSVVNVLYYKDLTITPDPSPSSGAVGNQNTNNCANVRSAITTLASIATSAITAGNLNSLPAENAGTFLTGETKCRRDIGHIVDAVAQDLWFGGNEYTIAATKEYFTNATTLLTNGVAGETGPSITSFRRAQDLMNRAANNQYYNRDLTITLDTTQDPPVFSDIHSNVFLSIMDNKRFIAEEAYRRMLLAYPSYVPQVGNTKQDCLDDVYNVLEQIAYDIKFGGNAKTYDAANVYVTNIFNGQPVQTFIDPERDEAAKVFLEARKVVTAVINNVTVTPTAGNTETQVFDFTQTDDWDAEENLPRCGSAIAASETLFAIIIQAIGSDGGVGNLSGITRTAPVQPTTYTVGNCSDVLATIDTLISITVDTLYAGNLNALPPVNNGEWDCANVRSTIDTLFLILTTALSTSSILTLPPSNPGPWSTVSESSKCRRDIGYIVEAITADLRLGGNENTINAAEAYFTGTGQQTLSGTLASNGVITGLTSTANLLVGMAVTRTSGAGSFGVNPTILSIDGITQITVTQTSGTVTAGAISFVANQLDYIEKERVETLDAYDYVRNIAISAMRNHNTYVNGNATGNSPVITVPSTNGLIVGMSVRSVTTIPTNTGSLNTLTTNYNDELEEILNGRVVPKATNYTTSIPSNAYIMKIGDGSNGLSVNQIQLGTKGSKFDSGVVVNASGSLGTNTPVKFFFQLETGVWANAIKPSVDNQVIQDFNYVATNGECSSVVENINTFFTTFSTVINNGIGSVAKKVSELSTGTFAQRATIFTLTDTSAGASPTNPHHLETGTPVRLVPRPKEGVTVDKRFIRLPRGFDTNTVYYIIAPGRKTDPYDYSNTTRFDGTTAGSFQSVMLASSAENAATGIYIYSSETEGIDENVVIDVYQYVLDVKYDLNQYTTSRGDGTTLVSEEPHVFDLPNSSWNLNDNQKYQAIFFKPVGNGTLPTGISSAREYYARYVNKPNLPVNRQFEVYDTLTQAIQGATPLTFPVFSGSFYTFSNKKRSPLRFAPEAGAALSYDETRLYVNDKSIFAINDYVKVADEFFFVTGISVTGSDHLVVTRSVLGTFPVSHSTGAPVNKWNYNNTATTTTLTETVDLVETIFDFTSVSGFVVGDFVRLTNSVNALNEVIKITKIEGTQVIASRAQLGTVVQAQSGTVTATRLSLTAASPAVTTTLSEGYPRLLTAAESGNYAGGTWYIAADSTRPNTILERIRREDFSTKDKTPDTWFERISDDRTKEDRVYRLRYVIPNYLKSVRDPLNGFIIKARNDQTRRLLPQKILVKPTASGSDVAELSIPNQGAAVTGKSPNREYLGYTTAEHGPTFITLYDPYNPQTLSEIDETPKFRKRVTTDSKVTFYVESARRVLSKGREYLQLTVFNIGIEEQGYKEKLFTTVKIDPPQGGTGQFVSNIANLISTDTSNIITWSGACKGKARVHAYFSYENQNYMILKDITGVSTLEYNPNVATVFTQGTVSSTLLSPPNEGRSNIDNYLYAVEGSNAYTMTPGDTFQAENGNYTIASVEDTEDFEDTFYIFDINEVRRRIAGQQDGVYYLTCLRGNISPFPTGAGVGLNFRNFKFSQPVSKLYPEFYKNDPEWYKQLDSAAVDAPETTSAADNYVHGLVTVNDSKSSVTREGILDFIKDRGSKRYTFTGTTEIKALPGGASAGSEARRIPVCGNSDYPTEKRIYVELRRPSIARSGNHTFEYLGFGPGNYSTGFPSRQEVLLSDIQDFYAQAKRENGGIVFYTGLNSNGDLYIGNRKINAITGEETFLESAQLVESSDEGDSIGNFVTTFDGPVTFNDVVSFLAPLQKGPLQFTAPIFMDVGTIIPTSGFDAPPAIQIKSNISTNDDSTLRINPTTTRPTGDIIITDNRLQVAVLDFNTRGLQDYSIRTAINQVTPDQLNTFGQLGGGTNSQVINLGGKYPLKTGDILLKGEQVGLSGSIAWVYGNNFETVANAYKYILQGFGAGNNKIRILWAPVPNTSSNYTNSQVGIKSSNYQVKITGTIQNSANAGLTSRILGAWSIVSSTFSENNNFVDILLNDYVDVGNYDFSSVTEPTVVISISNVAWKEVGVIGAESIRTQTDNIGDYRVGINTVARTAHTAYTNGFVESGATDPRANLDIVGTTFISGKTLAITPNNYIANATLGARTFINQDNAVLVGGDSANPNNAAVFRLSTTNSGRVGINTTNAQLNGIADSGWYAVAFAVIGNVAFSGNLRVQTDLAVNGGDITTSVTTTDFNFLNQSTYVGSITDTAGVITTTGLNIANYAASINIGTNRTDDQYINIANVSDNANVRIANNPNPSISNVSKVNIGGAFNNNESQSYVSFDSKLTRVGGDLALSYLRGAGSTVRITVPSGAVLEAFNDATTLTLAGNASTISFGGQGGTTRIKNSLIVDASLVSNGNFTMNGGLSSFDFNGLRGQMGTTPLALTGTSTPPLDKTVDLVTIVNDIPGITNYYVNQLDTAGSGDWGGIAYQVAITNILGATPNNLPALTGKQYYLPLETTPTYNEGDYLLIDTAVISGLTQHPEIVRIPTGGLVRTGSYPYYIIVERQPLGTFAPIKSNHPDNPTYRTKIRKLNVAFDATWTTNNLTASSGTSTIQLAEFGGSLGIGDYIISQRRPPFNAVASNGSNQLQSVVSNSYTLAIGQIVSSQTAAVTIPDGTTITGINGTTVTLSNPVTGNGSAVFNIDVGEIIKISTSLTSTTRKLTINNGANPALTTFEVNTVNGDTIIGNPNIANSGNLSIYGNISLVGGCGDGSTTSDRKLTFRNDLFETVSINTCNGNTTFGSPNAEVFVLGGFFGSTKAAHTTTAPVYAYATAPETRQGTGPLTTIQNAVAPGNLHTGGTTQPTWDIPVNSILGFSAGDLVLIVNSSLTTSPTSVTKGEIIRITGTPFTSNGVGFLPTIYNSTYPAGTYPTGGRGQETTIPNTWTSGDIVVKISKDDRTTTLGQSIPATGRTVVELPNTNTDKIRIKLVNGDLVSPKLDDQYLFRIGNEFFLPDSKSGAVDPVYGIRTPKSYRDPATISTEYPVGKLVDFFGGGELTIHDNLNMVSGNLRMFGSDGETVILSIGNDDGHSGDPSQLDPELVKNNKTLPAGTTGFYLKGPASIHGDLRVVKDSCKENGVCEKVLQFEVINTTGETYVGDKLYVRGQVKAQADSSTPVLHIDNLGAAGSALVGPRDFIMYQDGSVDAFGIKQYFTANGGRRWTYLPFSLTGNGQTQGNPLQANNNYLLNPPTSGNMIVYLPTNALTGDIIRFIDITGNLQYNASLVIRALKINGVATGIQGDFTGTKANQGSSASLVTAWDSGEMIVQTRNASFGLLFVGDTDATGDPNGLEIPSNLRGWFLVEL